MKTYRTAQVAQIIGIHPNTVRLYEELGLISRPERRGGGAAERAAGKCR